MSDFDGTTRILALRTGRPAAGEEVVLEFHDGLHERNPDSYGLS